MIFNQILMRSGFSILLALSLSSCTAVLATTAVVSTAVSLAVDVAELPIKAAGVAHDTARFSYDTARLTYDTARFTYEVAGSVYDVAGSVYQFAVVDDRAVFGRVSVTVPARLGRIRCVIRLVGGAPGQTPLDRLTAFVGDRWRKRPGVKAGLPLEQAATKAMELNRQIAELNRAR